MGNKEQFYPMGNDDEMKYCRICLATDSFISSSPLLCEIYSQLVQVVLSGKFKLYVCYECSYQLMKFHKFRMKCMTALNVLSSIHTDLSKISKIAVKEIDRKFFNLESSLDYSSVLTCNSSESSSAPKPDIDMDVTPIKDVDKYETKYMNDDNIIYIDIEPEKFNNMDIPYIENIDENPEFQFEFKPQEDENSENVYFKVESRNSINNKPLHAMISSAHLEILKKHATFEKMTPLEAMNEMLLRKESGNYKFSAHKCDFCYMGFLKEFTWNNHMKKHNPEIGKQKCKFCSRYYRRRSLLDRHIMACHTYRVKCKSCDYVCYNMVQAKGHIDVHRGLTYPCEICGIIFRYPHTRIHHRRLKHGEHPCAYCGFVLVSDVGLKMHKKVTHAQDKTEPSGPECKECQVQFATETAYKRHLVFSYKHTVNNGCEECGESFHTARELRDHGKMHPRREYIKLKSSRPKNTGPKSSRPKNSGPKSSRPKNSGPKSSRPKNSGPKSSRPKRPRRRATGEKTTNTIAKTYELYTCEVCGITIKGAHTLEYHLNKHNGERPYECKICGKSYHSPNLLYLHNKARHTGEPMFQCDYCQRKFHLKTRLIKHIRAVHLRIRRFTCDICNKAFFNRCEMKLHANYVHFKKPWPKRNRSKKNVTVPTEEQEITIEEYLDFNVLDADE